MTRGPTDQHTLTIGCAADERYAMPMAVTLFSAMEKLDHGRRVDIYLLHDGIGEESKARLRRVLQRWPDRVRLHLVHARTGYGARLRTPGHLGAAAYLRLLLPDLVPAECTKLIYLDSDLLVRADLAALWDVDASPYPVMAVRDPGAPVVSSRDGLPNYREVGLAADTPYINSGVLVMNLHAWRERGLADQILRYTAEHHDLIRYADQDGINAILGAEAGTLDERWNVPAYIGIDALYDGLEDSEYKRLLHGRRAKLVRDAHVLHFVGPRKPWQPGCALPGQLAWLSALRRSHWYRPSEFALHAQLLRLRSDWLLRTCYRRARALAIRSRSSSAGP
jgi:lipopolysaccharide biosynthesis glycosyltransferase